MPKIYKSLLTQHNGGIKKYLKLDRLNQKIKEDWVELEILEMRLSKSKISIFRLLKKQNRFIGRSFYKECCNFRIQL